MRKIQTLLLVSVIFATSACDNGKKEDKNAISQSKTPSLSITNNQTIYKCEGINVKATFIGEDAAIIIIGDNKLEMKNEPSASGAKYSDGKGNIFWTYGDDEATLIMSGQKDRQCTSPKD
ncbi:MliC family protein [Rosenbergiella epipactidis]|uniref:MliC family protein n=1 Tax=Rosenbergiella epipactidis TaxID=1544694 RepID=UPI001F4EF3FD|nr:MliC family protein [Rosenbergiella epipactidis]